MNRLMGGGFGSCGPIAEIAGSGKRLDLKASMEHHRGVGFVLLIVLFVALVLVGVGFAIGLVACFLAALLVGLGIVSSSFVIGLRSGRSTDGIRAFFLQCGIIAGIPAGAVCAWLAQSGFVGYASGWTIFLWGSLGGIFAGILVALMLDLLSRRLHRWALGRIKPSRDVIQAGAESSEP